MSYSLLLPHRVNVTRPVELPVDGVLTITYELVTAAEPCRLDLTYIRKGKDPQWTHEAGRIQDRTGVAFFGATPTISPGYRLIVTSLGLGVDGTFLVDGNVEQIIGFRGLVHHIEAGVVEVPGPLA